MMLPITWIYSTFCRILKSIMKSSSKRNLWLSNNFMQIPKRLEWINPQQPREKIQQVGSRREKITKKIRKIKVIRLHLWSLEVVSQKLQTSKDNSQNHHLLIFKFREQKLSLNKKKLKKILKNSLKIEFWNLCLSLHSQRSIKNWHNQFKERL